MKRLLILLIPCLFLSCNYSIQRQVLNLEGKHFIFPSSLDCIQNGDKYQSNISPNIPTIVMVKDSLHCMECAITHFEKNDVLFEYCQDSLYNQAQVVVVFSPKVNSKDYVESLEQNR